MKLQTKKTRPRDLNEASDTRNTPFISIRSTNAVAGCVMLHLYLPHSNFYYTIISKIKNTNYVLSQSQ